LCPGTLRTFFTRTIMKLTFLMSKSMPPYRYGYRAEARSTASAQNGCGACHVREEIWTRKVLPSLGLNRVIELHHRNDRILKNISKCQWLLSGRRPRVTERRHVTQTLRRRLARTVLGRRSRKPFREGEGILPYRESTAVAWVFANSQLCT
jgi:hypothetical protein